MITLTQELTIAIQELLAYGEDPDSIQTKTCMVSTQHMKALKNLLPRALSASMQEMIAEETHAP